MTTRPRPTRCQRMASRGWKEELYAGIRRAVMMDGLSRREAAKRFGVHRYTITKILQFSVPPGYRRRERPAAKKLGPYLGRWQQRRSQATGSIGRWQQRRSQATGFMLHEPP